MNEANAGVLRRSFITGRVGRQTKFQEICGRITDLAYELGPDAKLPTVLQLRESLGVSIATLNSVLSELESQDILRRKHGVGIYVSPNIRRYRICLICDPSFFQAAGGSPFWGLLLEHTRRRAEAERETFSLHFALDATEGAKAKYRATDLFATPYLPEPIVEEIRAGRIDGVLAVGLPAVTTEWIERQNVALVAFAGAGEFVVQVDAVQSAQLAIAALADEGCQRIGGWFAVPPHRFIEATKEHPSLAPFREAMAQHNLAFDDDLMWDNTHLVPDSGGIHVLSLQEQGYHAVMELFGSHTDRSEWCDGIYSNDESMTQGILAAFHRLGIQVGEDVKIATQANVASPTLLGYENQVIRIEIDPADIVARMFGIMEALLHQQDVTQGITRIAPKVPAGKT